MSIEIDIDPNPQVRPASELAAGTFVRRRSDTDTHPRAYFLSRDEGVPGEPLIYYVTDMRSGYTHRVDADTQFIPYSGATIKVMR